MMRHLDLFSGIGGFALAARMAGGIETVAFCEIDEWAQRVLAKNFPNIPIHSDVRNLDTNSMGTIHLVTGGYPCQPFSVAGKQRGEADDRHLWPAMRDIIQRKRPRWVLCENVAGHIKLGLDQVLSDLESLGYTAWPLVIPACAVDAPHRRDRVWIIAYANSDGVHRSAKEALSRQSGISWGTDGGSPAHLIGMPAVSTPRLCRASDGVPNRMVRLRGLGNAIVPQVAAQILSAMIAADQAA